MEVSSLLPYTEPESPRLFSIRLGEKGTDKPMKISTLREFVALAKNRSFVRAAKELYVSQPSLSAHIAALEKDLGFTLADREGGHFVLTPAGMSFLEYAQSIISLYDEARERGRSIAQEGPLIRMASAAPGSPLYEAALACGGHRITFVDMPYNTSILASLSDGSLDVGICHDFTIIPEAAEATRDAGLRFIPTGTSRLSIAMAATNPLASATELHMDDLRGHTVNIGGVGYFDEWRALIRSTFLGQADLSFKLSAHNSATEISREDLGGSLHICESSSVTSYYRHRDDIVVFDQVDGRTVEYTIGIAYRTDPARPEVESFALKLAEMLR